MSQVNYSIVAANPTLKARIENLHISINVLTREAREGSCEEYRAQMQKGVEKKVDELQNLLKEYGVI